MAQGLQAANLFPVAVFNPKRKVKNQGLGGSVGPGTGHKVLLLDKGLSCCTRAALTALTPHTAGGTEVRGISALSSVFHLHACPQHCCFFSYLSLPSHFILFHCSISSLCAGVKHVLLSHLVVSMSLGKLNVVLESLSILMVCFTQ